MPDQKSAKPKKRKLTGRQKKLLQHQAEGKTLKESAILAGYSEKSASAAAYHAMNAIKEKVPDLFERHGLDDDSFIKNYLLPALNATEVKAQAYEGRFIYSKPMISWPARISSNRLMAELKGLIVKERDTPSTSIRVVVVNAQDRPSVRGTSLLDVSPA